MSTSNTPDYTTPRLELTCYTVHEEQKRPPMSEWGATAPYDGAMMTVLFQELTMNKKKLKELQERVDRLAETMTLPPENIDIECRPYTTETIKIKKIINSALTWTAADLED